MRISWYSNSPDQGTGYGTQTASMLKRLVRDGHELLIISNYGDQGTWRSMNIEGQDVPIAGTGIEAYSNDVAGDHHRFRWGPNPAWMITLYDVWPFKGNIWNGVNIASWAPVDHSPLPPECVPWATAHPMIAMSKYGEEKYREAGVTDLFYAPHGVERDVFHPTELLQNGMPPRESINVPADAFLVTINSKNQGNHPPRKAWGEMFTALSIFMERHDDVQVYVHAHPTGVQGIDLLYLAKSLGISHKRLHFVTPYLYTAGHIKGADLAAVYTASDVLLQTSMGEGFGLPAIEAQACGTPVIVSDFSAQPELVGAGWKVPVQPYWDAAQGAFMGMPLIAGIIDALEEAYKNRGNEELSRAALAKAAEYDYDLVYDTYWRPILAELERRLVEAPPVPLSRAERRRQKRAAR